MQKKSCENVKLLGWPPPVGKFTTFFFSNDNLPKMNLLLPWEEEGVVIYDKVKITDLIDSDLQM